MVGNIGFSREKWSQFGVISMSVAKKLRNHLYVGALSVTVVFSL